MSEDGADEAKPGRMTRRGQRLYVIGALVVAALLLVLLGVLSHLSTPRGRPLGQIDLLQEGAPPLEVDAGGRPLRFSIDMVADTGHDELWAMAENGRLSIVAERDGGAALVASCATFAGIADRTSARNARPQILGDAELDCVLPEAAGPVRLRATATWSSGSPQHAVLTVRAGDER